jgi:hypothetical protein
MRSKPVIPLLIILATALVVTILAYTHTSDINGPWYWRRNWCLVPYNRYWLMLLCAIPFCAAQRFRNRKVLALGLLVLCAMQLRVTHTIMIDRDLGFGWMASMVRSPTAVSYYNDAGPIGEDPYWLAHYPQILPLTSLHTCSKPPGAVFYYLMWIRLFGYGANSAMLAGMGIIVIGSFVVPLVYLMVRTLTDDAEVGFIAASFFSLYPAAAFVVPMFDPIYAGWTCLIVWTWTRALKDGSMRWSLLLGVSLAAGAFFSYTALTLGSFLALLALFVFRPQKPIRTLGIHAIAAVVGFCVFYGVLWLCTFFDPVATFQSAWHNQHKLLSEHRDERPYPKTILFDLTDFALGMNWVGAVVVAMAVYSAATERSMAMARRWLIGACAFQPVLIAVSGLLQSETLRVWNFMLPLAATAAGIELAGWPKKYRLCTYAAMFIVMLAIGQNMEM